MYSITYSTAISATLKESIRDLVRLQQMYDPSDELLWAFFNARVLLNQPIAVDDFVQQAYTTDHVMGHKSVYTA
ncbi:hypothetical protein J2I47_05660 [Fibrella sp. HMF5335]|uniref:Uncharacterized protein n=1 Tax=Fibrella rubiginis TaxID=2817060 RepID=A0A939GBK4_9BACT|nr:hypothetical protein [Fibrella rubiginis]MBO0936027.1 hypothetical protein [Fibrella rubiginis]